MLNTPDPDDDKPTKGSRGIQSIEVGGALLHALVASGAPLPLKDLARAADMSPAKAHPYLVSFGKLGLVEQDPTSGRYGLGPLALQMGLIGLKQADPVRLAFEALPELAEGMGCTVSAAVWGDAAPVIVRVQEPSVAVRVAMKHGLTASLRKTATGKIYCAYAPEATMQAAFAASHPHDDWHDPAFAAERAAVRQRGLATVQGELIDGINAMAVPVFDAMGRLVLAIAAMAPASLLSTAAQGPAATQLRHVAARLSEQLGYRG